MLNSFFWAGEIIRYLVAIAEKVIISVCRILDLYALGGLKQ